MGNSKHRKNHKQKLAQRKTAIEHGKNQYKKFMKQQIEAIHQQIANNKSTSVNMGPVLNPDTSVSTDNNAPHQKELENTLQNLEKAADGLK